MSDVPVTILMPVYNCREYVREAIDSILGQTFRDFEFLIIDDGSTDDTNEIIRKYSDDRIIIHKNEKNLGLIATLNKGLDLAKGRYIARMDGDDISVSSRLEKQINFLEAHPDYIACGSWVETFKENEKTIDIKYNEKYELIRIKSMYQNHFCHGSSLFKTDIVKKYNLRFENKFIHAEDYYFFVKLSEIGKLYNIQEILLRVRQHNSNVSALSHQIQHKNSINVIKYQLNKIGINANDINFNLYFRFFYSNFDLNKEEINITENFLINLIKANSESKYFPQNVFFEYITNKWFSLCMNSTFNGYWIYKKFKKSILSKKNKITKSDELKLILKSIFKLQ